MLGVESIRQKVFRADMASLEHSCHHEMGIAAQAGMAPM